MTDSLQTTSTFPGELHGANILIVGINYWPERSGNAPYTAGLAEHLAANGCDVTVLAGMPYYPQWDVPEDYRGKPWLDETHNGVRVLRVRQYVPKRQSAVRRMATELSLLGHLPRLARMTRPDAIVGYLPMVSDAVLAAAASKRFNVPYGLIVQDLSGQAASQTGIAGGKRVAGLATGTEAQFVRRASQVAIVAEGFRPHVEAMGVAPDRIHRVRNWTHISSPTLSRDEVRDQFGIPRDRFVCLHAGNMGLKQGLENVVETARIARASNPEHLYVFMGGGNQESRLRELAADLDNVIFLPGQPDDLFASMLAASDVLLVNQLPTVVDMCLPGKLTSYLSVERPVVAAVTPESDTAMELTASEAGLVVQAGSPEALLAAIVSLESDPILAKTTAQRGKSFAQSHLTPEVALAGLEQFVLSVRQS